MARAQVCRVEKNSNYTTMGNFHLRDKNLSLKAKGLLSVVLSLPPDWDYSVAGLVAIVMEKETVVRSCLKELKKAGYLVVKKERPTKENGGHFNYIYIFYEKSQLLDHKIENSICENLDVENLGVESLDVEVLDVENQGQINTNILSKEELSKEELKMDSKRQSRVFKKPSVEEVRAYCEERKNKVDAEAFVDFYESKGWVVGKSPMKNWKAAVRTWERNGYGQNNNRVSKVDEVHVAVEGEDITYQRMFEKWKRYLGVGLKQTESQVKACNELLDDLGEDNLERLIVALRMRSEHGFLTRELKSVKDFVTLNENKMIVQNFYNEHWKMWQMKQEANQQGKKIWEL